MLTVLWLLIAVPPLLAGLDYYLTPMSERAYSDAHSLFAPTGLIGHSLGILGSLFILVGVTLYSLRKRVPSLARIGTLRGWLRFHIFLCTVGPFLVLLHTSFKFGGIVSIAFWSMTAVVASGIFGRYVYVRIPKTMNGRFESLDEIRGRMHALETAMRETSGLGDEDAGELFHTAADAGGERTPGLVRALILALRFDLRGRARARRAREWLEARGVAPELRDGVVALVRERTRLEQQLVLLAPFRRMFRYWHTFHLPLAIVMLIILLVHVAVAVAFGYGWPL